MVGAMPLAAIQVNIQSGILISSKEKRKEKKPQIPSRGFGVKVEARKKERKGARNKLTLTERLLGYKQIIGRANKGVLTQ